MDGHPARPKYSPTTLPTHPDHYLPRRNTGQWASPKGRTGRSTSRTIRAVGSGACCSWDSALTTTMTTASTAPAILDSPQRDSEEVDYKSSPQGTWER